MQSENWATSRILLSRHTIIRRTNLPATSSGSVSLRNVPCFHSSGISFLPLHLPPSQRYIPTFGERSARQSARHRQWSTEEEPQKKHLEEVLLASLYCVFFFCTIFSCFSFLPTRYGKVSYDRTIVRSWRDLAFNGYGVLCLRMDMWYGELPQSFRVLLGSGRLRCFLCNNSNSHVLAQQN